MLSRAALEPLEGVTVLSHLWSSSCTFLKCFHVLKSLHVYPHPLESKTSHEVTDPRTHLGTALMGINSLGGYLQTRDIYINNGVLFAKRMQFHFCSEEGKSYQWEEIILEMNSSLSLDDQELTSCSAPGPACSPACSFRDWCLSTRLSTQRSH